jgi:3-hydroxyisobutyrate dehydrogenase-like beta-hydroxyacid dehydrogenase
MMDVEQRIGLVGLGLMGAAIAERLLEHGYSLAVWNRTPEKAEALLKLGARWSGNPFADCRRVIVSLYSSEIVAEVMERMSNGLQPRQIVIDMTTGEPADAMSMAARLAERGVSYLDAPISGSSEQTRRGEATVMVGGEQAAFDACADLWAVLGGKTIYAGASGCAAKLKLVTNLVLGLNRAALAEGVLFADAIGVPAESALEALKAGAAYSRAMDVKGPKMIEGDFRPQAKLSQHLKDVRLILESAARARLALPLSEAHRGLLERAEALGLGELDNSAVLEALRRSAS